MWLKDNTSLLYIPYIHIFVVHEYIWFVCLLTLQMRRLKFILIFVTESAKVK